MAKVPYKKSIDREPSGEFVEEGEALFRAYELFLLLLLWLLLALFEVFQSVLEE